ncbi:hypothetical protein MIND_00856300 [Mycena indigotica]|uniref:IncA domain-containing protein n=1 Tax=Mycena indigotica TaxID=2126181 RepID=A0A8H6SJP0_9AGAR|nr:uncharacterized protein MIND_00856300 [Mycena indigotica]KAF7299080.1 hypothetical protein MIND_00856300 [Mycena indigotica]
MSSLRTVTARALRATPARSRPFSTSRTCREVVVADVGVPTPQKKPVGAVRGGIVGFLAGFSLAASVAAYNLLDQYNTASAALQASVDELKQSTEQISTHIRRIEAVEKDQKALADKTARKEDLSKLRSEVKQLYDGLHGEFVDMRSHVWGMQQDIHALSKKDSTTPGVRI